MRNVTIPNPTTIECNESTEGESIEDKIKRAIENQEPIDDSVELIFTERNDGVGHLYNPRGDKWEEAVKAMGQNAKSKLAQRKEILEKKNKLENPGTPESQEKA